MIWVYSLLLKQCVLVINIAKLTNIVRTLVSISLVVLRRGDSARREVVAVS